MGFLDKVKAVKAMYDAGAAAAEHWARIVSVDGRPAGATSIDLEIHEGGRPPFVANALVWVPKDVTPHVGMDVDFRTNVSDDFTGYEPIWDTPPRYGAGADPNVPVEAINRLPDPSVPGAPRTGTEAKLAMARMMLDKGLISQADFDHAQAAVDHPATPSGRPD